jgi:hypothetical protein
MENFIKLLNLKDKPTAAFVTHGGFPGASIG